MRSAVFVDAGYLYAQGSAAAFGEKLRRNVLALDLPATISKLIDDSMAKTAAPLLRIYWYDGLVRGRPSPDQVQVANSYDVRLRLGIVNTEGHQKGVDSLIVTDLIELARNRAIGDAIILSGDEDLRIGVLVAQSYGVRVHLIGIEPAKGSQSLALLQEVDTASVWTEEDMKTLLTHRQGITARSQMPPGVPSTDVEVDPRSLIEETVRDYISQLTPDQIAVVTTLGAADSIPSEMDRVLLATCRTQLSRYLEADESDHMRSYFKLQAATTAQGGK